MSVLAHKWVSSGKLSGKTEFSKARVCVILHGIMGSGRNWMTPAKRIVETNPDWKCLLIDHRCHGGSPPSDDSSTTRIRTPREQIDSCAADVEATIAAATGVGTSITPSDPSVALLPCGGAPIIMGHSFGGKVALAYAHRRIKEDYSVPTKTWMLDSMPGRRRRSQTGAGDGPGSVGWVLSALERAASEGNKRGGFTKRSEVQSLLVTEGLDALTAAWLSQSVRKIKTNTNPPSSSLLEFGYDLPGVRTMFEAFGQADMWDDCFDLASRDSLGLVVAGDRHTGMWEGTEEHLTKLEAMGGGNNDRATSVVHEMPHAGHNVHVDDLDGLLKIIMEDHKDDWNY
eukprot:CAMPEP_0171303120 /NCGR_PEP_ID=MMETSP0816-20121228/12616_1 /TAXON_ID=420281 /ORGANISM="Proboscia inermis, Strain CCAP1064/1" /LENGTH=341 /DNA_ID=CAMNT_0011782137 /DNA_START=20 /DNA_END=1045 /DNA_ORIENTATION=-